MCALDGSICTDSAAPGWKESSIRIAARSMLSSASLLSLDRGLRLSISALPKRRVRPK